MKLHNKKTEEMSEEPKTVWYINEYGSPIEVELYGRETIYDIVRKSFGNSFATREEAEKAVEKLNAWKRLKDIGCSFEGWNVKSASSEGDRLLINLYVKDCTGCEELLDLLFGGKE